jgi:hypothetical protein
LWRSCYRNPAQKGTFLSSYDGDILMEFRHFPKNACEFFHDKAIFPAFQTRNPV